MLLTCSLESIVLQDLVYSWQRWEADAYWPKRALCCEWLCMTPDEQSIRVQCTSLCEIMKHIFRNKKGRAKLLNCKVTHPQCGMHFDQVWLCMHLDACMFQCKKCMCGEWVWVTVWGLKWLSGKCECGGTHLLGSTRPLSSREHVHWSSFSVTESSSLHGWWNEAPSETLPTPPASVAP